MARPAGYLARIEALVWSTVARRQSSLRQSSSPRKTREDSWETTAKAACSAEDFDTILSWIGAGHSSYISQWS